MPMVPGSGGSAGPGVSRSSSGWRSVSPGCPVLRSSRSTRAIRSWSCSSEASRSCWSESNCRSSGSKFSPSLRFLRQSTRSPECAEDAFCELRPDRGPGMYGLCLSMKGRGPFRPGVYSRHDRGQRRLRGRVPERAVFAGADPPSLPREGRVRVGRALRADRGGVRLPGGRVRAAGARAQGRHQGTPAPEGRALRIPCSSCSRRRAT